MRTCWIFGILLIFTAQTIHAGGRVVYPAVPVLINNEVNVLAQIEIDNQGAGSLDSFVLTLDGDLPEGSIKSVSLYYGGTMSVLYLSSSSQALKEHFRQKGGGTTVQYGKKYSIPLACEPYRPAITFHPQRKLVPGKNYFWLSAQIDEAKIGDIGKTFSVKVSDVMIDGRKAEIAQGENLPKRLGVAVRQSGDDGAFAYRIPGLATTNKGTLIAVYDIRYSTGKDLQEDIDIGMSRSTDGGRTWEDMRVIMDMGEWGGLPEAQNGIGDPAVLVDETSGDILAGAVWTHGIGNAVGWTNVGQGMKPAETAQMMITRSRDDGSTWSEPVNVTSDIKRPEWYFTLFGPGKGITMKDGTLVFPMQYINTDRIPSAGIMYSRDGGKSWQHHAAAKSNTTESQVVELSDGVLMLNMRDNRTTGRAVYTSSDMGRTWREHPSSGLLREPVCMASLINIKAEDNILGRDILLFSNPDTLRGSRSRMTIKASLDGGYTWPEENSLLIDQQENWGYSCMTQVDRQSVGILYEGSGAMLTYQKIPLTDIVKNASGGLKITDLPALPMPLSAMACGRISGELTIAGGSYFIGDTKHYSDKIFTLRGNKWVETGKLPYAVSHCGYAEYGGGIVMIGGVNENGALDGVMKIGKNGRATALPKLPSAIGEAVALSHKEKLYLVGGAGSDKIYRFEKGGWKEIAVMPEKLAQPIAGINGDQLYVWCGYNGIEALSGGYRLNLADGALTGLANDLEVTFVGSSAFSSGGKMFVIGGVDKGIFSKAVHFTGKEKEDYARQNPPAFKFNNKLYVYDYSAAGHPWSVAGESGKLAIVGAGIVADKDGFIVIGGELKPRVRTANCFRIELR